MDILTFKIGDGMYASPERWIKEVASLNSKALLPIPGSASYVLGVAVVHGDVIPVLDLAPFVGSVPVAVQDVTPLLVCQVPAGTVGVVVSSVSQVFHLSKGLAPVGDHLRTWERLLLGVTPDGVGVINLERLLSNQGLLLAQDY